MWNLFSHAKIELRYDVLHFSTQSYRVASVSGIFYCTVCVHLQHAHDALHQFRYTRQIALAIAAIVYIFGHLFVSLFLGIFNLQFIVEITSVRIKSQVKTDCDTLKVFASFMKFSHFKVISRFLQYCVTSVADLCFIKKDIIARWIRAGRVSPLINAERTSSHFTRYSATIIVLAICTRF